MPLDFIQCEFSAPTGIDRKVYVNKYLSEDLEVWPMTMNNQILKGYH